MDHPGINSIRRVHFLFKSICHIDTNYFKMRMFPERIKIAKVNHIFKSGNKYSYTKKLRQAFLSEYDSLKCASESTTAKGGPLVNVFYVFRIFNSCCNIIS